MAQRIMDFDAGWETIQGGIDKVVSFVDAGGLNHGEMRNQFTADDLMYIHGVVYRLCTQKRSFDYELYSRYKAFFQDYIHSKILPAVREKSGELLLREVVKQWQDYKFITRWISRFFHYLNQFFIHRHKIPTMDNTALLILQNMVYEELKGKLIGALLSLINEDREGNSVHRALIKEVLIIVYDLQSETLNVPYQIDFEPAFLDSSCAYYLMKMDKWLQNLTHLEYMSQVVECMNAEKFRATQYLHPSTLAKLLELLSLKLRISDSSDVNCLSSRVQQLELGSNIV